MYLGLGLSLHKSCCCCGGESTITCADGMDIVFLVDYTGSMGDAIDNVKMSIASIVQAIVAESANNYRLGLVLFDEYRPATTPLAYYEETETYAELPIGQKYTNLYDVEGTTSDRKQYITAMEVFSENNETSFINKLNLLNTYNFPLGYGQSFPEPSDMGLDRIVNFDLAGAFRDNVTKLVILITDAPSSGDDDINNATDATFAQALIADCIGRGVKVLLMKNNTASKEPLETIATGTSGLISDSFAPEAIVTAIEDICIVEGQSFTFSEIIDTNGASIVETNIGPLTIEAKATSYQVSPVEDGYIKVDGNTIKTTTLGSRGHTLAVLDNTGTTVGSINTYDTFGESPSASTANLASLVSALNSVQTGNYVVLVSWDACAVNQGLRDVLNNSFEGEQTTTWSSTRYSHIFIGKKA